MTILGGEETVWGTKKNGFFITCTKCGWHSKVNIYYDHDGLTMYCGQCDNEWTEE